MWISNFFELFELYYILNFFRPFLDFKLISSNFTTIDIADTLQPFLALYMACTLALPGKYD